jgi:acyl dehydratase
LRHVSALSQKPCRRTTGVPSPSTSIARVRAPSRVRRYSRIRAGRLPEGRAASLRPAIGRIISARADVGAGTSQRPSTYDARIAASEWKTEELGNWTETATFAVEKERTIAYAKATNDPNPRHLSGELAPPVFAIVPPFMQLMEPTGKVVPNEMLMRVVHGEQDMYFHQPIVPGMELVTRACPMGVHKAPSGVTLHTKVETKTSSGEPINDQWMIAFFRGATDELDEGSVAPAHRIEPERRSAEPIAEVAQHFDDDQTYRYAEASGDPMPIHTDEEFAKSVGLPGIIIHGLCTMALDSVAVIEQCCDGDPERLRRLAVRFSKPGLPGEDITTSIWSVDGGRGTYCFETAMGNGDVIIKDGLAEVGEPR